MAVHHMAEAAKRTPGVSFGSVDCNEWTDVCAHEKITHYPTVRVYRTGRDSTIHKGLQGPQAFTDAAHL